MQEVYALLTAHERSADIFRAIRDVERTDCDDGSILLNQVRAPTLTLAQPSWARLRTRHLQSLSSDGLCERAWFALFPSPSELLLVVSGLLRKHAGVAARA